LEDEKLKKREANSGFFSVLQVLCDTDPLYLRKHVKALQNKEKTTVTGAAWGACGTNKGFSSRHRLQRISSLTSFPSSAA
jgi:hypothetical protein